MQQKSSKSLLIVLYLWSKHYSTDYV